MLIKRTSLGLRERANLEFRCDFINLFNRTRLADAETVVPEPDRFGRVFEKMGQERQIQLGLRINW